MLGSNRPPSPAGSGLEDATWPEARVGEALRALARRLGVPAKSPESEPPPPGLTSDEMARWISAVAEGEGLQTEQVFPSFAECGVTLAAGAPALVRVTTAAEPGYLAVLDGTRQAVVVLRPDLHVTRFPLAVLNGALLRPLAQTFSPEVDRLLRHANLPSDAATSTSRALLGEYARTVRVGGVWLLRPPMPERLRDAATEAGLTRGALAIATAHLVQAALFVASWWVLGRGLLEGRLDRGWLLGWLLLVFSLVPLRLITSWLQGLLATTAGATLRRRLLRGALRVDSQEVRTRGAGQYFGTIAEGAAVESLALSGGLIALLATLELVLAAGVLWAGAGWMPAGLLLVWLLGIGWLTSRFVHHRRAWTTRRLGLTERLLEHMVGHRTRLAQQRPAERHRDDDDRLGQYMDAGVRMDRWELRLLALAPRGWMATAMGALAPAAVVGMSTGQLAASLGGMLLAYRAIRRLTGGLADITGAAIAAEIIGPLSRAAARREAPTVPSASVPPRPSNPPQGIAALARDIVFRYRPGSLPVLQDCGLRIPRGSRLLLEGPSGSGKTTLASMFAGLAVPESGLLLIDGFDRGVLGKAGWRARVIMAPQPHDNYIMGGSLALNLLMGRQWPARPDDLVEAEQVCRELGLGELIGRMPGGLHQAVGETGWQLSQGEQTRVFLARALLQRPDLLILDESFGALDPENVDRAVRCVTQRAPTVLAIAHT